MNYTINDISNVEKEIEVTLTHDDYKKDFDKEYKKITNGISYPGFRKGKVPANILKQAYGDSLNYDAAEKVIANHFFKLAEEKDIKYISRPSITDIKFEDNSDLVYKVKYEVFPQIELNKYTGLSVEVPEFVVSDEEINEEIKYQSQKDRILEETEVVGDETNYLVGIDAYKVEDDGKISEEASTFQIDMSNDKVNKSIIDGARGKKVGETFDFTFEDPTPSIEGEEKAEPVIYKYQAKVTKIEKYNEPEFSEDYVKKLSANKFTTLDEYKESLKKDIQEYYNQQADNIFVNRISKEIIDNNPIDVPQTVINNFIEDEIKREEEHQKEHKHHHFNKADFRKKLEMTAENDLKWMLLRDEIIKKENITVNDEDILEKATKEAERIGIDPEKMLNFYRSHYQQNLIFTKLVSFLKENNNITKVDPKSITK